MIYLNEFKEIIYMAAIKEGLDGFDSFRTVVLAIYVENFKTFKQRNSFFFITFRPYCMSNFEKICHLRLKNRLKNCALNNFLRKMFLVCNITFQICKKFFNFILFVIFLVYK